MAAGHARRAFSLVELLIVMLAIGTMAAMGAGYYGSVAREARVRAVSDTLGAFLAACRARADQRGLPVTVEVRGLRLVAADSLALSCPLPPLAGSGAALLHGLRFAGTRAFAPGGEPLERLDLTLRLPGESLVTLTFPL